jgi:hypothetical protein
MTPNPSFRHFVIVREDLPEGVRGAMIIHATGESCEGHPKGTHAYALVARNEDHLMELAGRLWDAEIPHVVVTEPDAPYNDQAMAIGIFPTQDKAKVDRVTSSLPLLGGKRKT